MNILPRITTLFFSPTGQYAEATIVALSADLAGRQIGRDWWSDPSLRQPLVPAPIDRHWDWNGMAIEHEGRPLASVRVAVVTGDGAVQGAMMVSTDPVPSILTPGKAGLFVELLFTAPRNRPALRRDGRAFFLGVGTELLTWAARLSHDLGCEGRLLLDGSPDYVTWYEKRGLQKLAAAPILFEGVGYAPMELPSDAAEALLADWA